MSLRRSRLLPPLAASAALGYALLAGTWILVSDRLLVHWFGVVRAQSLQTLKGWLFVAVTGVLLWMVLHGYSKAARSAQVQRFEAERQLAHAQRLESLGRLAAIVAHDFNQVLTAVIGYEELAAARLADGELDRALIRRDLREIRGAADRGAALAAQLVAFGRKRPARLRDVALDALVRRDPDLLRPFLGQNVDLRVEAPPDPLLVRADPSQLEQVLANLAVNARDAMPQGGELTLRCVSVRLVDPPLEGTPEVSRGSYARLEVTDTGIGMDEATRERIFEPFFTTKGEGGGSGLGLAVVHAIVKQHGGTITVTSTPGAGTTFRVYLPLAAADAPVAWSGSEARQVPGCETEAIGASTRLMGPRSEEQEAFRRAAPHLRGGPLPTNRTRTCRPLGEGGPGASPR
jgi:signal transduction histidine kinase